MAKTAPAVAATSQVVPDPLLVTVPVGAESAAVEAMPH